MSRSDNFPIKKTGNVDNERVQINKALADIFETLARSGEWDGAFEWGDHNKAGYATELTETEQFEALGLPQNLQLTEAIVISKNGTERNTVEATWLKVPDDTILYDLEIRQSDPATVIDATDPLDILNNTTMFTVAIVGNEEADSNIVFNIFLDGGVRYWFRLRIRKGSLVSPWTDFENVTTSLATAQPDPPQSLTVEPIIQGALVKWTIPTDSAIIEKMEVYRREVGQTTDPVVAEVANPGNTFTDADLDSAITYEYKVASVSFRGVESNPTDWISVQPLPVEADFVTPAVPANPSATQELVTDNAGGQAFVTIDVSWDVVSGDNITYDLDIVRGGSVQVNTPVISNPASGSRVNYEFQVPVGTVLAIKVRSRNATSVSAFTATENITANADATGVDVVRNLQAQPLYQGALVSWDNPANVNYKYAIVERRRTAPGATTAYTQIGKIVRPSSFLFDDVGELSLDANDNVENRYDYRVTGYSSANQPGPNVVKEDITPLNIPPDSITADQIVAFSITAQEIQAGTITANEIDANTITANEILAGSITSDEITVGTLSSLSANLGTITAGSIALPAGGFVRSGQTAFDTGTGFFLGNSGGTPVFSLGNSAGNKILWNGSNFTVNGRIIDGQTNIVSGSINASDITTGTINAGLITTGTLDASQATITNLNATNITTGTLSADRLATSVLLVGADISALTNDAGFTDFDELNVQAAIDNNVTVISGSKITTGTINASLVDVTNIDADNITAGTIGANNIDVTNLVVKNLQTATSGQRVEITDPGQPGVYLLWIGDGTKDDSAIFWVKEDGTVFINKQEFGIVDGQVNAGAFSAQNLNTGGTTGNTLSKRSDNLISVGAGGIKLDVNYLFAAGRNVNQITEEDFAISTSGDISGSIEVLRGTTTTLSGTEVQVNSISFYSAANRSFYATNEGGLSPGVMLISNNTDFIRSYVDNPTPGDYYYWVRFSQWNANGFSTPVADNEFYVTFVTGT